MGCMKLELFSAILDHACAPIMATLSHIVRSASLATPRAPLRQDHSDMPPYDVHSFLDLDGVGSPGLRLTVNASHTC